MDSAPNPYAAPVAATDVPVEAEGDWLQVRREHINAEANIKSVGLLDYLGGALVILGALAALPTVGLKPAAAGVLALAAFGAGMIFVGVRLRKLTPWARIVQTVVLVLGMLGSLGSGTGGGLFWGVIIAFMLWSRKASVVFSEHYRTVVIPATPSVKAKTSIVVWIVVGLMVAGFLAGLFAVVFAAKH